MTQQVTSPADANESRQSAPWSKSAIASLVLAVLLPPIGFIAAIIVLSQQPLEKRGGALAGLALVVGLALSVFLVLFLINLAGTSNSGGTMRPH